ncbi:MAG: RNB domain-containing ribonuclease [Endomicrobiales bacterium]
MELNDIQHRSVLQRIAHRVMIERGLLPDFSVSELFELHSIMGPAMPDGSTRDLRNLLWCSIDNDGSRDLDQLTVAQTMPGEAVKILVAISDVDAIVKKQSPLDEHARQNTTSVYTVAKIFPMLPDKLCTDLTSLTYESDRLAIVIEMDFSGDGSQTRSIVYEAVVRNRAKLAYGSVAAWLGGHGPVPADVAAVVGLDENIRLQYSTSQNLKASRHRLGALDVETIQARPVFEGEELKGLTVDARNEATEIIEEFMIAANGVCARYLASLAFPSLQRVVRVPKRWDRIIELAAEHGATLPAEPDSKALDEFLNSSKNSDPAGFADLSMSVIKLMGAGEYVVQLPGALATGHFSLALREYARSTAPNRRYPDLITQRLLKAAVRGSSPPYENAVLELLAQHCTMQEGAAKKVERQLAKSAAAILLTSRIKEQFDAIVTGSSAKGTWVRIEHPPVEGKLESGFQGIDVGHRIRVQLVRADVNHGYIDFKRV